MKHILTTVTWNISNWEDYDGEVSKFGWQMKTGKTGAEGENFNLETNIVGSFKYGYFPQNRIQSLIQDPDNGRWSLIFTSNRPNKRGGGRFIVGIYSNAKIGEYEFGNVKCKKSDVLILERGNYLLFNRIHHCRKKDACRPLIYIDDIDLKHILGDILGLYQNNRVIRNKIFNYSKSINLQIKEREPESYKPKIKSQSYIEGDTTEIIAEIKKRDKKLINDAKRKYGFICSVCGFDFMKAYGTQYIEIHHLFPLSKSRRKLTKLENVRPVCANCHRIIHKSKNSMIDIEDLRQIVNVKFEY